MNKNVNIVSKLLKEFYPYAKTKLGFKENCKVKFIDNADNYLNPLGRTAQYEPATKTISLFITGRHPKDILRSFSHELVHHNQNCEQKITKQALEGSVQKDQDIRKLEQEAYLKGNMIFRDWENERKIQKESKQMLWRDKILEMRNQKLMDSFAKKILNERLRFDTFQEMNTKEEPLDELLIADIKEMLRAGERIDDIKSQLFTGENLSEKEIERYIKAAIQEK